MRKTSYISVHLLALIAVINSDASSSEAFLRSDEVQIRFALERISLAVQKRNPALARFAFDQAFWKSKTESKIMPTLLNNQQFNIQIVQIDVNENEAVASCSIKTGSSSIPESIIFRRAGNNTWNVVSGTYLHSTWSQAFVVREGDGSDVETMNFPVPQFSNKMFLPVHVIGTSIFSVNSNHASNLIGHRIFTEPIDMQGGWNSLTQPNDVVTFFLDTEADRVVVGKGHTEWLGEYGTDPGDYRMRRPTGMAISPGYDVYITVPEQKEIVHLLFNYQAQTFSFAGVVEIPGVYPSDIAYDKGAAGDGDDVIWVADEKGGKIVKLNRQLQVLQTISTYLDHQGVTRQIEHPRKLMIHMNSWWTGEVAFISGFESFVLISTIQPAELIESVTFGSDSYLSSIGLEPYGTGFPQGEFLDSGFLLTDQRLQCVHKITASGYVASFRSDQPTGTLFFSPKFISPGPFRLDPGFHFFNINVLDVWGPLSGLREFYPGADAINLSVTSVGNNFEFRWKATNFVLDIMEVVNPDGSVVTIPNPTGSNWVSDGDKLFVKPQSDFQYGNLTFRVKVKPIYNIHYPSIYIQDWLQREVLFARTMSAPSNVSASGHPSNVILAWNGINGVQGYHVYRSTSPSGPFSLVASPLGSTTSWVDDQASSPQIWYYYVAGYIGQYEGSPSTTVNAQPLHLQSTTTSAIANNSQRKIIRTGNGYYACYESGGHIWITRSWDGYTWDPEKLVSSVEPGMTNRSPSISMCPLGSTSILVAWEVYGGVGGSYTSKVKVRQFGYDLSYASSPIGTWETGPMTSASQFSANPQLAPRVSYYWQDEDALLVWYDPSGTGSVRFRILGRAKTGELIPGRPTFALAPNPRGGNFVPATNTGWSVAWTNGTSISHRTMGFNSANNQPDIGPVETVLPYGNGAIGRLSLIFVDNYPALAWFEDLSTPYSPSSMPIQHIIRFRQRTGSGWNGTVTTWFVNSLSASPTMTFSYYQDILTDMISDPSIISIFWEAQGEVYRVCRTNAVWSTPGLFSSIPGATPSVSISVPGSQIPSTKDVLLTRGLESLYPIQPEDVLYGDIQLANLIDPLAHGRGVTWQLNEGFVYLRVLSPSTDNHPIGYRQVNDTVGISRHTQFEGISGTPLFRGDGMIEYDIRYRVTGTVPSNLAIRMVLVDGVTDELLRELHRLQGAMDTSFHVTMPMEFPGRSVKLKIRGLGLSSNTRVTPEQWFVPQAEGQNIRTKHLGNNLVQDGLGSIPQSYALHQNYPNPFNPSTDLAYDLPGAGNVSLSIYDVLGRQITELVNGVREAGYHSVTWNATDQASGVYLARFSVVDASGKQVYSKINKLVLMK